MIDFEKLCCEIDETELFYKYSANRNRWHLRNTEIGFYFYRTNEQRIIMRWYQQERYKTNELSFEAVLELVPEEIQNKLLYHLNLFR